MEYLTLLFKICQMQVYDPKRMEAAPGSTAGHSLRCLETVVRIYYLRHSFEFPDTYLTYFLSILANVTIGQLEDFEALPGESGERIGALRSTLILCMKGLQNQGRHIHLASLVGRLLRERMQAEDIKLLRSFITMDEDDADWAVGRGYIRSDYPVSIAKLDHRAVTLDSLVKQYDQMSIDGRSDVSG
jgi:hypothetical protein